MTCKIVKCQNMTCKLIRNLMAKNSALKPLDFEEYEKIDTISITESRSVYTGIHVRTNTLVSMYEYHFISATPEEQAKFVNCVTKMKGLNHPGLLPVIGYIPGDADYGQSPIVVYENPGGENLAAIIDQIQLGKKSSTLDFTSVMKIIYGTMTTIAFLHANNIVHGDIQPSSIFLTETNEIKIASYGIMTENPNKFIQQHDVHTLLMLSAEMITTNQTDLTFQSDIYALAMLIYRIAAPAQVFKRDQFGGSFSDYIINTSGLPQNIRAFSFLSDFIIQGWEKNPENRPQLHNILRGFKNDILLFCTKLDKGIFLPYAETMESHIEFINNIDTTTQNNSLDGNRLRISLMDVQNAKMTKEGQEITSLKYFGKSAQEKALFIILLQNALMEISPTRFDQTCTWILKNINFSNSSHLTSFINNFFIAVRVRFKQIDLYCKVIIELLKYNQAYLNTDQIKALYIKKIFDQMLCGEPYPSLCSNVCLLRELYVKNVYSIEEILNEIKLFYTKRTRQKRLVCLIFTWFAKEIYEHDKEFFDEIIELFKVYCEDVFFPESYRAFYVNLSKLMENDWSAWKENVAVIPQKNTLIGAIFHDDLDAFKSVADKINLDEGMVINPDTFEVCCIANAQPSLYMYANVYGSSKIYEYIRPKKNVGAFATNLYKGPVWDKQRRMLPIFAAAGGKTSFFRRFANKELDKHDGCINYAIQFYQQSVYELLLQKDIDPSIPDKDGRLSFVVAAMSNNIEVMIDLLNRGLSPSDTEVFQRTPLHAAAEFGNTDALAILLDTNGVDVNAGDAWNVTPLHVAADKCQVDSIKLLLQTPSVDVNARNDSGKTPLHFAVETNYPYIAKLFIEVPSVDINAKTKSYKTALHIAAKKGSVEIVELLLTRDDVLLGIADKKGRTPYMIAVENEDEKLIEIFENFANKRKQQDNCRI